MTEETRRFDLDGWGLDRMGVTDDEPKYQAGDRIRVVSTFRDIVFQGGQHIQIEIPAGVEGVVTRSGPDPFGLVQVKLTGVTVDAWDSDLEKVVPTEDTRANYRA